MNIYHSATGRAGLGALALALFAAGCGGGATPLGPTTGLGAASSQTARAGGDVFDQASPDRHHRRACTAVTNSQGFNGTAIAKGSWIWFSSVTMLPGGQGAAHVDMADSKISFSDGVNKYVIKGPAMRERIGGSNLRLRFSRGPRFDRHKGAWELRAPGNTAGNDLLNAVGYQVPRDLPGGISNVTWSAKFYSKSGVQNMHWQWAAAVYTQMTDRYKNIGVKPLDDNHYPPYNSDHAGTPENYKAYLTAGATGGGGSNYTGGYSGTVNVVPCK